MTLQGKGKGLTGSPSSSSPPNPPAGGEGQGRVLLEKACPRCGVPAGEECIDRNGRHVTTHAARGRSFRRKKYDPEVERMIEKLPGFDPHQVYGAVTTIRFARDAKKHNPELHAGFDAPSLSPESVALKVRALYKWEAVIPLEWVRRWAAAEERRNEGAA